MVKLGHPASAQGLAIPGSDYIILTIPSSLIYAPCIPLLIHRKQTSGHSAAVERRWQQAWIGPASPCTINLEIADALVKLENLGSDEIEVRGALYFPEIVQSALGGFMHNK
jgi:hypothetical protein